MGGQFKKRVLELGQKKGWFGDSIDWSQDLDWVISVEFLAILFITALSARMQYDAS